MQVLGQGRQRVERAGRYRGRTGQGFSVACPKNKGGNLRDGSCRLL